VHSNFYENKTTREPLMSQEPLLYLSRNSGPSNVRAANYSHGAGMGAAVGGAAPKEVRARVMYDFDGTTAPNCLSVNTGEIVVVEDRSSPDWWDCRNANGELGFVPLKFLSIIEDRGRQIPHKAVPMPPAAPKKSKFTAKPVPIPPSKPQKNNSQTADEDVGEVIDDFDGRAIPNALSVVKGEKVTVVDRTNAEWWDVVNQSGKIGFIPANFVRNRNATAKKAPPAVLFAEEPEVLVDDFHGGATQEFVLNDYDNDDDHHDFHHAAAEDEDDMTMEIPVMMDMNKTASIPLVELQPKKKFSPAKVPAPTPKAKVAPIPGVNFVCQFDYEPMGDTEIHALVGDLLVAPIGADLTGEWIYVLNRRSDKKGFIPATFIERKKK
jgi:hypothetical protein